MARLRRKLPAPALLRLPNSWDPRWYQRALWDYFETGGRRGLAVCHRRWGKDDLALHRTAVAAHEKSATYWHLLPEYQQARKSVWNAINPETGKRRIDEAFPEHLRASTNEQEMFIRFTCGSTWQLVGSDNYNAVVGSPPYGIVFSEWALANPAAWAYLSPILEQNGGWALFIYTPRGRNHGYTFWRRASSDPDWFGIRQGVNDTDVFSPAKLAKIKLELIDLYGEEDGENLFNQEYHVNFDAAVMGSYYGRILARLDQEGRITSVPHDPQFPVYTAWDLGIDDATAIWFVQLVGREVRWIDHLEARNRSLTDIAREVLQKPYVYAEHYCPHDIDTRELTTAKTRKQTLEELRLRPIRVGSRLPPADRVNALRNLLTRSVFDAKKCERGLEALRHYHAEWDEKARTPRKTPRHDWSSHTADAAGEMAVQLWDATTAAGPRQRIAEMHYDVFDLGRPQDGWNDEEPRHRRQLVVDDYDPFAVR
jgi:phage terminase large subunit